MMHLREQVIRFAFVGLLNTLFGYSLYALLIFLKLPYAFAVLISTVIGVIFNFKTTGKLVFNNTHNHLFFKFLGVYGIVYLLNILLIKGSQLITPNLYFAGLIAVFPCAITAFLLNKNFVFRNIHETH